MNILIASSTGCSLQTNSQELYRYFSLSLITAIEGALAENKSIAIPLDISEVSRLYGCTTTTPNYPYTNNLSMAELEVLCKDNPDNTMYATLLKYHTDYVTSVYTLIEMRKMLEISIAAYNRIDKNHQLTITIEKSNR